MKKAIVSLLISAIFIYLAVRGVDLNAVIAGMDDIGGGYVLLFLLLMVLMQALRIWRWGLILAPLAELGKLELFAVASVGFFAIAALPVRLGELVRPYLVSRSETVKMSAALGTIFVERFLDGITVLVLAFLALYFAPLPSWLLQANFVFLGINIVLLAAVIFAVFRRARLDSLLNLIVRRLPATWAAALERLCRHFLDGLQVIGDGSRLLQTILLSLLIWLCNALAIYCLFLAFHLSLPPVAALVIMVILIVGIAIPAAPGFIGNWHYFCVLGLSLYGIAKAEALAFAVVYHFLAVGLTIIIGLIFLPQLKYSFAGLWQTVKKTS